MAKFELKHRFELDNMWDLLAVCKDIVDTFFKTKTPGIHIDIELKGITRFEEKDRVKCKISIHEKRYSGNKLFAITRFTVYSEDEVKLFEEYLNGLLASWGVKPQVVSDTDSK